MKKGFTLIEVLGVIILLGLLALVVFPSVVNQMKKIDSNVNESTKKTIYMAADEYIADNKSKYQDNFDYNSYIVVGLDTLVNNGYLTNNIDVKDYKYVKINIENGNSNSYKMLEELEKYDLFDNGDIVYFNPTNGEQCREIDYTTNLNNYSTTNKLSDGTKSPTGLKSGCMKWYAFNDSVDNGLVNLILDHNTMHNSVWGTDKSMNIISSVIKSDTDDWDESLTLNKKIDNFDYTGYKSRLITANEVAQITGADEALQWSIDKPYTETPTIGSTISFFYLDGKFGTDINWQTLTTSSTNKSKFAWLFNNTYDCLNFGCEVADQNTYPVVENVSPYASPIYGYWTSTYILNNGEKEAWHMPVHCKFYPYTISSWGPGFRPVIMVNKEIFE